jgi:Fe2+ transport system protein FeoA
MSAMNPNGPDSSVMIDSEACDPNCDRHCPRPATCPLSRVKAGMAVRIRELSTTPEVAQRLREIGFGERQVIRLLIRQANLICQVCNTRLALSAELAQMIIVEPLPAA